MQEIDLSVCTGTLWKRKFTILVGALIPAVVTLAVLLCLPAKRSITYTYATSLKGSDYRIFERHFYGTENLLKLETFLRDKGFGGFADDLDRARQVDEIEPLKEVLLLDRFPSAKEAEKEKENVLQQITLQIRERSYRVPTALATAVRDYFEEQFPLYRLDTVNMDFLQQCHAKLQTVQMERANIKRTLRATQTELESLKKLVPPSDASSGVEDLVLPMITGRKEFFPIEYHVRALLLEVANIQRKLEEADLAETFYSQGLELGGECDVKIKELLVKGGTISQFNEFLQEKLLRDKDLAEVMSTHVHATELSMLSRWRTPREPNVGRLSKGTVLYTGLAFAVALPLMIGYILLVGSAEPVRRPADSSDTMRSHPTSL